MIDYAVELATQNAPRMAHMSDADIRAQIAALKALLPMYRDSFKNAVADGYQADLRIYRDELLRRACVAFGVPMLDSVQMIGLEEAARKGGIHSTHAPAVAKCEEMVALGLLTSDGFALTQMARDLLEAAADEAPVITPSFQHEAA